MDATTQHKILKDFLETWPLSRIREMTLEEYVVGRPNYKETLCYWVETYTQTLGNIKGLSGGGSFKFGIFFKNTSTNYDSKQYMNDDEYAWQRKYGENRNAAFEEIKQRVIEVITHSLQKDFKRVDNVDKLFSLFKWKLAFLYSDHSLVPFYKHSWLEKIASELGYTEKSNSVPDLQRFIIDQRTKETDFFEWYNWLKRRFILNNESYYLVGSNYYNEKAKAYESVLPDFYESSVIAVGFLKHTPLDTYFNVEVNKINDFLRNHNLAKNEIEALRHLLSIKKGDIIAIKEFGIPTKLKIAAYAIVVEDKEGNIYRHDPEVLGHCVNVEFLEIDVDHEVVLNKTHTIHRITDETDLDSIFGAYQILEDENSAQRKLRKGTTKKHTAGHSRTIESSIWVEEFHNQLQEQFYESLKLEKDDPDGIKCKMEENYVDVSFRDNPVIELYEVKTSPSPARCIRDAFGQLMYYSSYQENNNSSLKLYVVGPGELQKTDKDLLSYVKRKLNIQFDYICFPLDKL